MSSQDYRAHVVLVGILVFYAVAYVTAASLGVYVFIFKNVLIPAFAVYALRSREIGLFVRAWLPFLSATVLFDATRGAIYRLVELGYRPVFAYYVIEWEQSLLGTPAGSISLQAYLRTPSLDRIMVAAHGAHFGFFLFFGLVVWHARREWFARYVWSMLATCYLGAVCYLLVPTVPPWMAAEQLRLLPPIDHVVFGVYNTLLPSLHSAFDTNPVAAMPSLHAAFPAVCALLGWSAFGRLAGTALAAFALLVSFAMVYLGEHYVVDVLAGYLLAVAAYGAVRWWDPPREPLPLGRAVGISALLLVITWLLVIVA